MESQTIVAQFHEYSAAHRALCELVQSDIPPDDISIIAGDRSNHRGASRDFGVLNEDAEYYIAAVRRGLTLLAVRARERESARVAKIIEHHAPAGIARRISDRVFVVTSYEVEGQAPRDDAL
jgi:hypothetical protein